MQKEPTLPSSVESLSEAEEGRPKLQTSFAAAGGCGIAAMAAWLQLASFSSENQLRGEVKSLHL